jgi:transcriptional regulator
MGAPHNAPELLPGTLEMLILRTLLRGAMHGYGIAQQLKLVSMEVLDVGESSLYPALQRLLLSGYAEAEWGCSDNNRRARFYTITRAGRKRLQAEQAGFDRMVKAIYLVLDHA